MNELPALSPAVPIINALIAGISGVYIMHLFSVPLVIIFILPLSLFIGLFIYLDRLKITYKQMRTAVIQLPVYVLRVCVALSTSNLLRLVISITVTIGVVQLLGLLAHFLGDTFLFYHLEFADLTLAFLLVLVISKKVLYLSEILWNREKYHANMQRVKGQEISKAFFYKDIAYSFFYGTAGGMFGTIITYGLIVIIASIMPTIDLTTPIGIAVLVFLQYYVQQSGFQEYKFYTNHKYMHALPYYNILHIEHHVSQCPTALIGYGEAGYLESTVQILFFFGSLPGLSGLMFTIEFTNNELYHAFQSHSWMKNLRRAYLRVAAIPGVIYAAIIRFVIRSKSKGATPMAYNPERFEYIKEIVDVAKISDDDIEYELHGQHHWFNVPFYGEGLVDYYMGKEYNS